MDNQDFEQGLDLFQSLHLVMGNNDFYHDSQVVPKLLQHHPSEPGQVGDAKFVTIWHNDNGVWKVTRVISYEHNEGLFAK